MGEKFCDDAAVRGLDLRSGRMKKDILPRGADRFLAFLFALAMTLSDPIRQEEIGLVFVDGRDLVPQLLVTAVPPLPDGTGRAQEKRNSDSGRLQSLGETVPSSDSLKAHALSNGGGFSERS